MYKGYIYRHWRVLEDGTEKSYIGQVYSQQYKSPEQRWGRDGKYYAPTKKREKPTYFWNSIQKYGWNNFNHKVLFSIECKTKEELWFWLDEWECYYIWKYDSYYNGYNSTLGGNGTRGYKHTEQTRQKMSESLKGKPRSEETKQKISETQKGKPKSDKHKKRISENHADIRGDKNPRARTVICLDTFEVFTTAKEAEIIYGGYIIKACKGRIKTTGKHPITGEKLHWQYYDEYLKLQEEEQQNKTQDLVTTVA